MLFNSLDTLGIIINLSQFMSGDFETLDINQPKITYFQKRAENDTEWLDDLINTVEAMKNKISQVAEK